MQTKVGIVGLPNVGKSSLFRALTAEKVDIANYPFTTINPNVGVVKVPDSRLNKLADLSNSKKVIPAVIEFYDIAGLVKNASQGEGLGNQFLSHIREVDAICEVVRVFQSANVVHVEGLPDPERDMGIINLELVLADLQMIEKIIAGLEKRTKQGDKTAKEKLEILLKIKEVLLQGKLASKANLSPGEKEKIKDVQLLTLKPFIFVLNVSQDFAKDKAKQKETIKDLSLKTGFTQESFMALPVKLEADLIDLTEPERIELLQMEELELFLPQLIKRAYGILGLITFFTTGEDETRAWTVLKDSTAPEAGAAIHTDFKEKFIRAEVINWQELLSIGGWSKAKELGKLKLVGRDYVVQDGDVIEFKI